MDCLDALLDPLTPPTDASSHSDPPPPLLPLARVGGGGRRRRGTTPRSREQQARSVARRNARERKRVKLVNLGFAALREHIPPHLGPEQPAAKASKTAAAANNKKLSKVDTLRCAIEYIKQLREAVGFAEDEGDFSPAYCETPSPDKMTVGDSSSSPAMFGDDENDDFFNIVDWTSL